MRLWLASVLGVLLLTAPAQAANHYVRAGASGTASGADWTNAYTVLPATLVRGDTYYIAGGSYAGYVFNTTASGTTLITIQKATVADHGTSTGWSDAFGTAQAVFTSRLFFSTSYWLVDGQTGGGPSSWTTGFGFKINANARTSGAGIRIDTNVTHVTIRHYEIQGNGGGDDGTSESNDGIATYGGSSDCTFSYGYIHDMGRTILIFAQATNMLMEYTYTGVFESTPAEHSELAAIYQVSNVTFRYNLFTFATPTGGIMASICAGGGCGASPPTAGGLYIYGNVFYKAPGSAAWGGLNGLIGTFSAFRLENALVYNNSFVNVVDMPVFGNLFTGAGTGNEVRNNLFYNVTDDGLPGGLWPTVTHNHWVDSGSTAGTNATSGTGNPFVNSGSLNFALTNETTAGVTLGAPYATDYLGATRGSSGTWTRGAVQFSGSAALTVTTTSLSGGVVNAAYSQTLTATGGTSPYTWDLSAGSLPAGLSLSSGGVISGTPSGAGTSNFTVRATDAVSATATQALSIVVTTVGITTTSPLTAGFVASAYSQLFAATGGTAPYTWAVTVGTLPTGLSLSSGGTLSGTPTSVTTQTFTVQVTDNVSNVASGVFTLSILQASPLVSSNIVVRYFFDEAASGSLPTLALDAAHPDQGLNMTLAYDAGNMTYVTVGSNRGLQASALTGAERADRGINDSADSIKARIDGKQLVTIELVLRVDSVSGGGAQSRIFGIIDTVTDVGRVQVKCVGGGTDYLLAWNNANVSQFPITFGAREVLHVVVDTTQAVGADRIRVYRNGTAITPTNTPMAQNEALSITTDHYLIAMNRPSPFGRSFNGVLFYAALYGAAFSQADVTQNYNVLTVSDDQPVGTAAGGKAPPRRRR